MNADPSMNAIRPPYTAAFNSYVRDELGYRSDNEYYILGGVIILLAAAAVKALGPKVGQAATNAGGQL